MRRSSVKKAYVGADWGVGRMMLVLLREMMTGGVVEAMRLTMKGGGGGLSRKSRNGLGNFSTNEVHFSRWLESLLSVAFSTCCPAQSF